jgi:hypothetical protein
MGTENGETPVKYIIKWVTKFWSKFSKYSYFEVSGPFTLGKDTPVPIG